MDELNLDIINAIYHHQTGSPAVIAETVDAPKSTVHYRIKNLMQTDLIKNELFDLDLECLGLSIVVITEVLATYKEQYHEIVGEKLAEVEGVEQVYFIMGETDFLVISRVPSREGVEDLIAEFESIDEIERTKSRFVISTIKLDSNNPQNHSRATITESIKSMNGDQS